LSNCGLINGPGDMQGVDFALLVTDFESSVFGQEIIHEHLFVEAVVADGKLIKQSSLLVFARFKFELFQILNIFSETLVEVLFSHERRNPSNDHSEHLPGLNLHFYGGFDWVIGDLIGIQFIVFFAHF
jgi:hypothetical protein